jgi:serine/threonine protein kinase/Tol biopolymer transport system component
VSMALAAGTKLDGYEILSLLGEGGMGEVYRARDPVLKRDVAIKVLPQFVSQDPDRMRRFEQEAQAAAALNHPNILAVYQLGNFEGTTYLVSELLEGGTLRQELTHGALPARKAIDYGVQIAHGLAAAHHKGIVHRDLKPENIFISRDARAKILDFGLAKLTLPEDGDTVTAKDQTTPGQVLGTAGYMAPEQVRGETVDQRADIFAFGAILYELVTRQRAFKKPTSAETMTAILHEDPPAISLTSEGISPGLLRIVQRCLEKKPERRFQSASDLAFALEALSDFTRSTPATIEQRAVEQAGAERAAASPKTWKWVAAAVFFVAVAAGMIAWLKTPAAVPVVESVTQLTDDGEPKNGQLVSDGSRVYFNEGPNGSWKIAQVSTAGGRTSLVDTRVPSPWVAGIAPDNSSLLVLAGGYEDNFYPLWLIPVPAGDPRRLGTITGNDAAFFPDGRILFVKYRDLYAAEKDGSNPHMLASMEGYIQDPSVSADGKSMTATLYSRGWASSTLVQLGADGAGLRPILSSDKAGRPCCTRWSPDGRYLVYGTAHREGSDLWALPMQTGFLRPARTPIRLTAGPLEYSGATLSHDGQQIFAIGTKRRGELVHYDSQAQQFLPYLGGISAVDATFSRDGKWMTYVSYPDHTLWRSRADGTERTQLTYPPMKVQYPFISPDGNKVAFTSAQYDIYLVGADGGTLQKIVEHSAAANWSPDGNVLLFTSYYGYDRPATERHQSYLQTFDLRNRETRVVPSSEGKGGGLWVGQDGLIAGGEESTKFLYFDIKSQKWSELLSGNFVNWSVSPDGKYLYFTTGGAEPQAKRVRLSEGKVEPIAGLTGLRRVVDAVEQGTNIGVAPDGSPVFTRDIGTQEIYALNIKWP